ncbi:multicopper oxidase family protein [Rhizobium mesoamericanum]|uniref:Putative multicopper oxidase n=1 Tax=Rhizobium mesoamericanum STM3625 TaxID=1211777 RepID=K0PK56_9HYPH|nr:multicopper oxidase domain-containing protein [Rhizobium mesoamericanum]CCM76876.1 putative multicopper oxidase [Rhizobium mesoamericanum STM3625]
MYRREFLTRTLAGAAAYALVNPIVTQASAGNTAVTGSAQKLKIVKRTIEVNGKPASVFGLTRPDGSPGLILDAEAPFDVELSSQIDAPTLIHWHGLTPPWDQDGVPDNPAALITPGESRHYNFPLAYGGTHWMHAHTLLEQNLLAAPLIVHTADDKKRDEQEVVVLLHDFSFKSPEELLAALKGKGSGDMDMSGHDMGAMMNMSGGSMKMDMGNMSMGHGTAMAGMDINDIEYDAYLANDRTLDDPEVFRVEKGGRVRIRLINGATSTGFTIDTGGIDATLVAVDGHDIEPVRGRRFPATMGQRLDIVVEIPKEGGSFPVLALREGARQRTGFVLATPGAKVSRVATVGDEDGPVLGLDLEQGLRPLKPAGDRRSPRSYGVALTGDMATYNWSIQGDALDVAVGNRVEVAISNMSMMSHPMHLHGHKFQVVGVNGRAINGAIRDTVLLPMMSKVTIAFDADNPGHWPFHCHHLYHMASGMMTYVAYQA